VNTDDEPYEPVTPFVINAYSYVLPTPAKPPDAVTLNEPVLVEHVGDDDVASDTVTGIILLLVTEIEYGQLCEFESLNITVVVVVVVPVVDAGTTMVGVEDPADVYEPPPLVLYSYAPDPPVKLNV
jgi:hypothetical protein